MNLKYYHILADGKRIKEISWKEWSRIKRIDYDAKNTRLLCGISGNEVYLSKGRSFIWARKDTLSKILGVDSDKKE
jgi:hypothetical protein